jgi:uncharacterized protein (DUF1684 family)
MLAVLLSCLACKPKADPAYLEEVEAWHRERVDRLTAEEGWLSLAGLFWLEPGANTIGTGEDVDVAFPSGSAPARLGAITVADGKVRFEVEPGVRVEQDGSPVTHLELEPDTSGAPTILRHGRLTFYVIERSGRLAIRLKDRDGRARKAFRGIERYPVDPGWRIEARFEAHPPGHTVSMPTVLGTRSEEPSPGAAVFERGGQTYRLDAVHDEGSEELFFVFADQTSGKETYGGGRFLDSLLPVDDAVVLDFNRAYNPPCAFTPYATCPLPPKANRLKLSVKAGEKSYGLH